MNPGTLQANNDEQKDGEEEVVDDVIKTEKEITPAGGNQTEDISATDEREDLTGGAGNSARVEDVPVQMPVEANVAHIVNERVTSTGSHTKEDLALLKRKNPLGYLTAILEGRESSSDQSASTASGKSTSTISS